MLSQGQRYRPAWRDLQPGNPWTFITADPIRMGINGPLAGAGSVIEWAPEGGPPLLFHVDEITIVDLPKNLRAYSCTHAMQPPAFRGAAA